MEYQALFEPDTEKGGFVVTFPDFEWGVTQGDTEVEAAEMASDALSMVIGHYIENGQPLPEPGVYRGEKYRVVPLPALVSTKAELYRAFLASGMKKVELGRRVGIAKSNVDRLFNLKYNTRLEQIEAAFHAIGKALVIEVRNEPTYTQRVA